MGLFDHEEIYAAPGLQMVFTCLTGAILENELAGLTEKV